MFDELIAFIRRWYGSRDPIPLCTPRFSRTDRDYVVDAIESTFVSSIGAYVNRFEEAVRDYTGAGAAVATVNGTAALQVALQLAGVRADDEVVTQPLSFVATANAISYRRAHPVFLDVDRDTMGLSPDAVSRFLDAHGERRDGGVWNRSTGRRIAAIVPMHTFGRPCQIEAICDHADAWGVPVVEDAAEALGSVRAGRHCGTFGRLGIYSFNGNKTITTGGGGMIVTDAGVATRAKHLTTTAKVGHPWEYVHDEVGYNFRLPNLNAALGCAQMEKLDSLIADKRELGEAYAAFFREHDWAAFATEPEGCCSNVWLHAIVLADKTHRDALLDRTNEAGVMTRPIWRLMNELPMYRDCQRDDLTEAQWLSERVVTLPSSPREPHG